MKERKMLSASMAFGRKRTRMRIKEEEEEEEEEEMSEVKSEEEEEEEEDEEEAVERSKRKHRNGREGKQRWSEERYKVAERSMVEIMVAEGATFEKRLSRPSLRAAARKRIGDTGLLDHLLKHMEGKAAPGGTHRFRRWFNSSGVMEYWLESTHLLHLRAQAGVRDPFWLPPQEDHRHDQFHLLEAEFSQLKAHVLKQDQYHHQLGEMLMEMVKWKSETDQNLKLILSSWKTMQDMYESLMNWKAKVEQQVVEIKSALESKQQQSSERWEDWLESSEILPFFDDADANANANANPHSNHSLQFPTTQHLSANDVQLPHSSATPNPSSLCQELFVELFNWKAKIELDLADISNSLNVIAQPQP